jgi:hypothetical protein
VKSKIFLSAVGTEVVLPSSDGSTLSKEKFNVNGMLMEERIAFRKLKRAARL